MRPQSDFADHLMGQLNQKLTTGNASHGHPKWTTGEAPHILKTLIKGNKVLPYATSRYNTKRCIGWLDYNLTTAKAYIFDLPTTRMAYTVGSEHTELVCNAMPFLHLPVSSLLLVYPGAGISNHPDVLPVIADLLIDHDTYFDTYPLYVLEGPSEVCLFPWFYRLHRDGRSPLAVRAPEGVKSMTLNVDRTDWLTDQSSNAGAIGAMLHMLGTPAGGIKLPLGHLDIRVPTWVDQPRETEMLAIMARESVGHFRNVLAMVTLLTGRGRAVRAEPQPRRPGRFMHRGRSTAYMVETPVSLLLPKQRVVSTLRRMVHEAIRRRQHDVVGHWRHYIEPEHRHCLHSWAIVDDDHMECTTCKGIASWIPPHKRGDAKLGVVTHSTTNVKVRQKDRR